MTINDKLALGKATHIEAYVFNPPKSLTQVAYMVCDEAFARKICARYTGVPILVQVEVTRTILETPKENKDG